MNTKEKRKYTKKDKKIESITETESKQEPTLIPVLESPKKIEPEPEPEPECEKECEKESESEYQEVSKEEEEEEYEEEEEDIDTEELTIDGKTWFWNKEKNELYDPAYIDDPVSIGSYDSINCTIIYNNSK